MELILWRHAEAEDTAIQTVENADLERALTEHGKKQAREMARWLNKRLPKDIHILSSPAKRTRQTVSELARPFDVSKNLSPGASADDVLEALEWSGNGKNHLIVGHQPTLGNIASLLLCGRETGWRIKKGGVWWITGSELQRKSGLCHLRLVISPEWL